MSTGIRSTDTFEFNATETETETAPEIDQNVVEKYNKQHDYLYNLIIVIIMIILSVGIFVGIFFIFKPNEESPPSEDCPSCECNCAVDQDARCRERDGLGEAERERYCFVTSQCLSNEVQIQPIAPQLIFVGQSNINGPIGVNMNLSNVRFPEASTGISRTATYHMETRDFGNFGTTSTFAEIAWSFIDRQLSPYNSDDVVLFLNPNRIVNINVDNPIAVSKYQGKLFAVAPFRPIEIIDNNQWQPVKMINTVNDQNNYGSQIIFSATGRLFYYFLTTINPEYIDQQKENVTPGSTPIYAMIATATNQSPLPINDVDFHRFSFGILPYENIQKLFPSGVDPTFPLT